MIDRDQAQRLASMANILRPDWPAKSVLTIIQVHLMHRTYRELACAFAFIATDPQTATPKRIVEPGPWWVQPLTGATQPQLPADHACPTCKTFHDHDKNGSDLGCPRPVNTSAWADRARQAARNRL
jgi:hypothetical protein